MNDLHFIIVNSNLPHAKLLRQELENRVSFQVFQDAEDKDIWKLMQGGKDDIFVYDRCGRLAYYIPFPLSIMRSGEGLVPSTILATYYRSPCGETCDRNGTQSLENYLDNIQDDVESVTEIASYTEAKYETEPSSGQKILNSTLEISLNVATDADTAFMNQSSHENYDYDSFNNTLEYIDSNDTLTSNDISFFNSILNIFFSSDTEVQVPITTLPSVVNVSQTEYDLPMVTINGTETSDSDEIESARNETEFVPQIEVPTTVEPLKKKPERCAEAGTSVCKNWSKGRLLRAQTCCSHISYMVGRGNSTHRQLGYCHNYGKKRCKKIQTILKCCIKTALKEVHDLDHQQTTTAGPNHIVSEDKVSNKEVVQINCCRKLANNEKVCRLSNASKCDEGEFVCENPEAKNVITEQDTTMSEIKNGFQEGKFQKEVVQISCCRILADNKKLCRMSENSRCEDSEFLYENVNESPELKN